MATKPPLRIERFEHDGTHRLVLTGELDLITSPELDVAVAAVFAARPEAVEIDLRALRFIDSTGLRALITAQRTCADHQAKLSLLIDRNATTQRRLFELTGLSEHLPLKEPALDDIG